MLQAMLPAPFEIVPPRPAYADPRCVGGGPAPRLGRTGNGPSRSPLTRRIFSTARSAKSIDTDTMRRIETLDANQRSTGAALAASCPSQGARDRRGARPARKRSASAYIGDGGAHASRVVGYGAFALEYAASACGSPTAIASACFLGLHDRPQPGGAGPGNAPPSASKPEPLPSPRALRATFVTLTGNGRPFAAGSVRLTPIGR